MLKLWINQLPSSTARYFPRRKKYRLALDLQFSCSKFAHKSIPPLGWLRSALNTSQDSLQTTIHQRQHPVIYQHAITINTMCWPSPQHQQTLRNESHYDFSHTEPINQQQTVCRDGLCKQFMQQTALIVHEHNTWWCVSQRNSTPRISQCISVKTLFSRHCITATSFAAASLHTITQQSTKSPLPAEHDANKLLLQRLFHLQKGLRDISIIAIGGLEVPVF
jgi:hypothetical protein